MLIRCKLSQDCDWSQSCDSEFGLLCSVFIRKKDLHSGLQMVIIPTFPQQSPYKPDGPWPHYHQN